MAAAMIAIALCPVKRLKLCHARTRGMGRDSWSGFVPGAGVVCSQLNRELMMIRLTRKDFRRWLFRNRRVVVGIAENPRKCPFCRYLKWKGARFVNIQVSHRWVDGHRNQHTKWQREFQREAMRKERELDVTGLRGREALAILDGLAG